MKTNVKFTDRNISSEWPKKIVQEGLVLPNKDSYKMKRNVKW